MRTPSTRGRLNLRAALDQLSGLDHLVSNCVVLTVAHRGAEVRVIMPVYGARFAGLAVHIAAPGRVRTRLAAEVRRVLSTIAAEHGGLTDTLVDYPLDAIVRLGVVVPARRTDVYQNLIALIASSVALSLRCRGR